MKIVYLLVVLMVSVFANSASSIEYKSDKWEDLEAVEELKMLISVENSDVRVKNISEYKKMKEFLKARNSKIDIAYIHKSYKDLGGDDIDCIDMYHQPSLKIKGMEDHVIQLQHPIVFESDGSEYDPDNNNDSEEGLEKLTKNALSNSQCDPGSVPIKRIKIKHLARFGTIDEFYNKKLRHQPKKANVYKNTIDSPSAVGPTNAHQYAVITKSTDNFGINSIISAFSPNVEKESEFSLSQIWAMSGSRVGNDFQTVEAGLQSFKEKYGDDYARIFIYYTTDNYNPIGNGGCYNLDCSGFVQVDNSIAIGSRLSVYSQVNGAQYGLQMALVREHTKGNWWLQISGKWIGYWPNNLFNSSGLKDKATRVDAGGEIYHTSTSRHTMTDMGSGRFATEGWTKAAYHRIIQYIDTSNQYNHMTSPIVSETDKNCYDIKFTASSGNWKSYFYMGGTGYNENCQ